MRTLAKVLAGVVIVIVAAVVIVAALPNWNGLRGPIERKVLEKTGRALVIGGDLRLRLHWPGLRISADNVRFANPAWATRRDMVGVSRVTLDVLLLPLLRREIVFDDVRLDRARVNLEQSRDGRRNWLLDREQRDEKARVRIRHLAVSDGAVEYLDPAARTAIEAHVTTAPVATSSLPLGFRVEGEYRGQPLRAAGRGGSVLALRETETPYPLAVAGTLGPTSVRADGSITELLKLGAADLHIALRGGSLEQLYPIIGVVLPDTPPYQTEGRLVRQGSVWRYQKFSGRVGHSDIAGTLQIEVGRKPPFLQARLHSTRLDLADLGPLVGAGQPTPRKPERPGRVLPDAPFRTDRWQRMDADVTLDAGSIRRPDALPLDNLSTRLQLRGGVLTLSPLKFDIAGGSLAGSVKLDGRAPPIRADVDLKARKLRLARLIPDATIKQATLGQINGDVDLKGRGNSVADMLGSADGRLAMVIDGGTISRLMMEAVSLHLLEILELKLTGDQTINVRCGAAELGVKDGVARVDTMVFDTDIVRIDGDGQIDLGKETLDLRIVPRTRKLSLVALRTPIHIEGRFAKPDVSLDKGPLAARGLGAAALAAINPALALVPLIDANTAAGSECRKLLADARRPG